jgi:hypothetical protein
MNDTDPGGATSQYSRATLAIRGAATRVGPLLRRRFPAVAALRAVLLVTALLGALALIATDVGIPGIAHANTVIQIKSDTVVLARKSGGDRHLYALLLLGLVALPMAVGSAGGRSRPAGLALLLIAVTAGAITLIGDLPYLDSTGHYGRDYLAAASPQAGFYLETAGAVLLAIAAVGALLITPSERPSRRPRAEAAEAPPAV